MILFFDTETTGLPRWKEPSDHPEQPHLVQLAALLCTDDGTVQHSFCEIVNPGPGVVFEPEAVAAHGITPERAAAVGVPPSQAFFAFRNMANSAQLIVGHNVSFDLRIMRIQSARLTGLKWEPPCETFCTMKRSTNIVRVLHRNPRHASDWKWPRLEECIRHFFNEPLAGAHDALVDVKACMRVFFHLNQLEKAA